MATRFNQDSQAYKQREYKNGVNPNDTNASASQGLSQSTPSKSTSDTSKVPQTLQKIQSKPNVASHKKSVLEWFCQLPIGNKQLIALVAAQLISIVGLSVGARWLITTGLRSQLLNQASSEVTATESNINLKVNQTGLGFLSQSKNPAIVEAAQFYDRNRTLRPALRDQIKQTLQNEITTRNIEYATLVGRDFRIIANANTNRQGETFNPSNLVRQVFTSSKQIKANTIVSSAELARESPLPPGANYQDALIRYTLTPVYDPPTKNVIAVLISGDVVNRKLPIMAGILKDFGGGFSGIYLHKPTGEFVLTTSLDQGNAADLEQATPYVGLSDSSLLAAAASAPDGQVVTRRMTVGTQTYTMAAKAVPNLIVEGESGPTPVFSGSPVTILVRGTPETTLNNLLRQSLWQEGLVLLLALLVTSIWILILRRTITKPIQQLKQATQGFTEGDRSLRAKVFYPDEVGELAVSVNKMADSILTSEATLSEHASRQEAETKRTQQFTDATLQIRRSLNLEDIPKTAVKEVRKILKADRVVIYRFDSSWKGMIAAESVGSGWTQALEREIDDPCFRESYVEQYRDGRVRAIDNIYQAGLKDCHIKELEQFEVKANLVAPILKDNQLLGLLIAHQCSKPRVWQQSEIDLFMQLATQIGIALEQANLLEKIRVISQEQRQQKEALQHQLINLLNDVEEASRGNLTVRAEVTAGEIGTVADFFNAIIESLRQIVTSVKKTAAQVNVSVGKNEGAMRQLADTALNQAEEITRTLDSVEQMTLSIQAVADNARSAAIVASTAFTTVEAGGAAMDLTVQSILNLRSTVAETANKVRRLGESSQQISQVVSLINQIALQTNVLAINASIEAARAGEEGRGFAVVAEEIGQLAVQSGAATREIEPIVENIQRETSEVVKAMELGNTQVIEGTHLVEQTKKSLEQILDVSRQIDQLVQSISTATVSQARTSQAVTSLMKDIAKVSEHTSDSSRQISSSLQQTVEIAQQLQVSVDKFKVGAEN